MNGLCIATNIKQFVNITDTIPRKLLLIVIELRDQTLQIAYFGFFLSVFWHKKFKGKIQAPCLGALYLICFTTQNKRYTFKY